MLTVKQKFVLYFMEYIDSLLLYRSFCISISYDTFKIKQKQFIKIVWK